MQRCSGPLTQLESQDQSSVSLATSADSIELASMGTLVVDDE